MRKLNCSPKNLNKMLRNQCKLTYFSYFIFSLLRGSIESEEPAPGTEPTSDQTPSMWEEELLNTEQDEDYDSDEDEEYVPPVDLDSSFEFDEGKFIIALLLPNLCSLYFSMKLERT